MNTFDKVIGYREIKNELLQICDMIHNREAYEQLGAVLPRGVLLYGEPGLGKTLMAKCFLEESGLCSYTLRKNKNSDRFVEEISEVFRKAEENAPSAVFLDDMDKYANEDEEHCDAQEYVAVQAEIDEAADKGVFVLATANDIDKLPESLLRSGRFDRKICVHTPTNKDAREIIRYFLNGKRLGADVSFDDLAAMIRYRSCADLENIINKAAINAAYRRKTEIGMEDMIGAVLSVQHNVISCDWHLSDELLRKTALHEAGHLVVSEVLKEESIGLACVYSDREDARGFVCRTRKPDSDTEYALISVAGKAAVEMLYPGSCAAGCADDIFHAWRETYTDLSENGAYGIGLLAPINSSESYLSRAEAVVCARLEQCMTRVRRILSTNREFLDAVTQELAAKKVILNSDIRRIRESCGVVTEAV